MALGLGDWVFFNNGAKGHAISDARTPRELLAGA
jgi:hypothetical protein